MNDRYDGKYYASTETGKNKIKETCNKKYGCNWVWQAKEIKEKRKNSMLERHGV